MSDQPVPTGIAYCAAELRRGDPDRYMIAMIAPEPTRSNLMALFAFNLELARIPDTVSEPLIGQMRLSWWRDAVDECFAGTPRKHEVVEALAACVSRLEPPREPFDEILDGRELDAIAEAPRDEQDFIRYLERSGGALSRLGAIFCGARDDESLRAAEGVGIAHAMVGLVRSLPFRRRMPRTPLPGALLARHGLEDPAGAGFARSAELTALANDLLSRAADRLAEARRCPTARAALPILLQSRLAASYIKQLRRAGGDPFDKRMATPPPLRALSVGWGAVTGRW